MQQDGCLIPPALVLPAFYIIHLPQPRIMKNYTRLSFAVFLTFMMLSILPSCSKKISFQTSPVVPAAEGRVTVKKDDNKNYSITVTVDNLAEPERLTPPREVYVVWLQTENNSTRNIGQLKSSSGLFSSKLKATLKTVSAFKPTRVYITAEDSPDVTFAGSQVVLNTKEF